MAGWMHKLLEGYAVLRLILYLQEDRLLFPIFCFVHLPHRRFLCWWCSFPALVLSDTPLHWVRWDLKGWVLDYSLFTIIPNAVVSAAVLALAAREAFSLSNTYALFTLSDRQHDGLRPFVKIYCAKLLILEAILALSAGCDCLIAWIFKSFVPK